MFGYRQKSPDFIWLTVLRLRRGEVTRLIAAGYRSICCLGYIKRFEGDGCGALPLMKRRAGRLGAADETNLFSRERVTLL